ncbi:MAG: precorrin-6y C5,15-methyltransferase (decarboxylating) subunit CbiE [Methyloligellaceae bacterium]
MGKPWLTIVGISEDGLNALSDASRKAITEATIVFGGQRHLELAGCPEKGRPWPVPFSVDEVLQHRGAPVVVLASGDPFWFGAGTTIVRHLKPEDWQCMQSVSTFSLAASRLGWGINEVQCLGLHAEPIETLYPLLSENERFICLLRDGNAVNSLARWLVKQGFEKSDFIVLERLGGPFEKITHCKLNEEISEHFEAPVAVALTARGNKGLPCSGGLDDEHFFNDGQITKKPVRALTLSALAPRKNEILWDIGAGSGSISVEWLLSAEGSRAYAIEQHKSRSENIQLNASKFGLQKRLHIKTMTAPDGLKELESPDAVFFGGGFSRELFDTVWTTVPVSTRIVVNSVTLESQSLVTLLQSQYGGNLMRFDISAAEPLGRMRTWKSSRSIIQWSVVK